MEFLARGFSLVLLVASLTLVMLGLDEPRLQAQTGENDCAGQSCVRDANCPYKCPSGQTCKCGAINTSECDCK